MITNAIEALSMKLTYNSISNKADYNFRGTRAFGRDQENLTFNFLKYAKNYVAITYRQNTSRYLTSKFGVGLVKSGTRFSKYELSDSALEIVSEFNTGTRHYRDLLRGWVTRGNKQFNGSWLRMTKLQNIEKRIYNELHVAPLSEVSFFSNFKKLRMHNYNVLSNKGTLQNLLSTLKGQEKIISEASIKFLEIKNLLDIEVRKAGHALEDHIHNTIQINTLKKDTMVLLQILMRELDEMITSINLTQWQLGFISDSRNLFSTLCRINNTTDFLSTLLKRAPDFFVVVANGKYRRAMTYNKDNFIGSLEPNLKMTPYSIRNLKRQLEALND